MRGILIVSLLTIAPWQVSAASAQVASVIVPSLTAPDPAPKGVVPPDIVYPDAVVCNLASPDGIQHRMIFYKNQTISFGTEPNNVAEYGTAFIGDDTPLTSHAWRLQLGRPGNITAFAVPSGWKTDDCAPGKSIARLSADRQTLKLFRSE